MYAPHRAPPRPMARETVEDDRLLRLAADLANVRRNRDDQIALARAEERVAGARRLAEVYDDLVRSLDNNPDRESPWYQGHVAILDKVRRMLDDAGATEVGVIDEPFDPEVHEAIGTAPGAEGNVVAVARPGFLLDDGTLVRPAQVLVGHG